MSKEAGILSIEVPSLEFVDNRNKVIKVESKGIYTLQHSLKAIAEWEANYATSFFNDTTNMTNDQVVKYIQCMAVGESIPTALIDNSIVEIVIEYMNEKHTATLITRLTKNKPNSRGFMTSEQIYANMISGSIPLECESWNLERLFKLMEIINISNNKDDKMTDQEALDLQKALATKRREEIEARHTARELEEQKSKEE